MSFIVEVGSTVLAKAHLHYEHNFVSYQYNAPPSKTNTANLPTRKKTKTRDTRPVRSSSATVPDEDEDLPPSADEQDEEEEHAGDDPPPQMSEFEISLSALLNCINIFGESTIKPVSAKQAAAREKWKNRQNGNGRDGGEDEEEDPYEMRDQRYGPGQQRQQERGGSTVNMGKKKGTTAMVLSWEAEGCPLVLLWVLEPGTSCHTG